MKKTMTTPGLKTPGANGEKMVGPTTPGVNLRNNKLAGKLLRPAYRLLLCPKSKEEKGSALSNYLE